MKIATITKKIAKYIGQKHGLPLIEKRLKPGIVAVVIWGEAIYIDARRDDESKLSALLHELGHIEMGHEFCRKSEQTKELEAEMFSLCGLLFFGYVSKLTFSKKYLQSQGGTPQKIAQSFKEAIMTFQNVILEIK